MPMPTAFAKVHPTLSRLPTAGISYAILVTPSEPWSTDTRPLPVALLNVSEWSCRPSSSGRRCPRNNHRCQGRHSGSAMPLVPDGSCAMRKLPACVPKERQSGVSRQRSAQSARRCSAGYGWVMRHPGRSRRATGCWTRSPSFCSDAGLRGVGILPSSGVNWWHWDFVVAHPPYGTGQASVAEPRQAPERPPVDPKGQSGRCPAATGWPACSQVTRRG